MKTDDLITMLSRDAQLQPARPSTLWLPVAAAAALSTVFLVAAFGVREDLVQLAASPLFWLKVAFVAALAAVGCRATALAAIPGGRLRGLTWPLGLPFLALAIGAAVTLSSSGFGPAAEQFWGSTWRTCPLIIALLSLPIFISLLRVLKARAPTRLRLAGAAAGFAAGAVAATLYCLHCPELAPSFVGVWYVAGILIPTALGALIGRAALAW